ncbi:adenine phosphoribosyltransferase [Enorma phocaeensis]|uniref:adenine phosphoribosyltransferase n=1 Tax=Enorma phocaeensis TaxID=1871019 RepID=UPI000C837654|nr:adenine phosphoribosyltransferase [Enorma phocaeensis]
MADFDFSSYIADIPDYPEPGVVFKDITPLFADAKAMRAAIDAIADHFRDQGVTKVIGPEARGFMVGVPVALELGAGFIPARKPGKLPRKTISISYDLEYGSDTLEIHADALTPEDRVIVIDDLIATGGTIAATGSLVERMGATLVGYGCVMELSFLEPRKKLVEHGDHDVFSLVQVS